MLGSDRPGNENDPQAAGGGGVPQAASVENAVETDVPRGGDAEQGATQQEIEENLTPLSQSPEGISSPGLYEGSVGEGATWDTAQADAPTQGDAPAAPETATTPAIVPNDGTGNVPADPGTQPPSTFAAQGEASTSTAGTTDLPTPDAAVSPEGAPGAASPNLPTPGAASPAQEFQQAIASGAADGPSFKRGDLVEGTIVETSPTLVRVDIGGKAEGVIPSSELEKMGRQVLETLRAGETMQLFVVNPSNQQGNVTLSLIRAQEELDWQRAEQMQKSQETMESKIAGYNKGGLIVRFGQLRGFVPQSQMSPERKRQIGPSANEGAGTQTGDAGSENAWSAQVGQNITIKVMEVDRSRNRLILSERGTSRETREQRKANLISQLTVGEVRDGRVVSLEDFGAFIDIGGAEGLVHLTEISYQHVTHPRDVLKPGQAVRVKVISVDPNAKRIGLSIKQLEGDPWDRVLNSFTEGQLVKAQITKLTKFGAFAQIDNMPEIEGLIHISELADHRVNHPREVVNEGDHLTLRVVRIEAKDRRLALSLKKVNSAEYLDLDWASGAMEEGG